MNENTERAAEGVGPTERGGAAERRDELRRQIEDEKARAKTALEAMSEGKGRLRLDKPIQVGDGQLEELCYDFTALTGLDYTEAMDSDPNGSTQIYRISARQAFALFAVAAAKQTEGLDMKDILSRLGAADALAGTQLATLFFAASTRAGQKRISKR